MGNFVETFDDLLDDPTSIEQDINVEPNPVEPRGSESDINDEEQDDEPTSALHSFLKERGVKDPRKIQFTNEDGSSEDVDFDSLSSEEQLDIIRQVADPGLSESEIKTINYLRHNRASLEQVIDYFSQKRLQEYLDEHPEAVHQKTYEVDDYSDDDLFIIDLKSRFPDFSDQELIDELDTAKESPESFKKKVEVIRKTYKENEDQLAQEQEAARQQQVEDLRNNLLAASRRFNEFQLDYTDDKSDTMVIDEEDKRQMMSYILDQDADGKSEFVRDLEDPDRLIEIAWFSTQGPKMLSELTQYWKGLLAQERAENKKLQSKLDKLNKADTHVVISSPKQKIKEGNSIWDNSGLI